MRLYQAHFPPFPLIPPSSQPPFSNQLHVQMPPRPVKTGRRTVRYTTDANIGPAHIPPDATVTPADLRSFHDLPPTVSHRLTAAIATPQVYVIYLLLNKRPCKYKCIIIPYLP